MDNGQWIIKVLREMGRSQMRSPLLLCLVTIVTLALWLFFAGALHRPTAGDAMHIACPRGGIVWIQAFVDDERAGVRHVGQPPKSAVIVRDVSDEAFHIAKVTAATEHLHITLPCQRRGGEFWCGRQTTAVLEHKHITASCQRRGG